MSEGDKADDDLPGVELDCRNEAVAARVSAVPTVDLLRCQAHGWESANLGYQLAVAPGSSPAIFPPWEQRRYAGGDTGATASAATPIRRALASSLSITTLFFNNLLALKR